MDAQKGRGIYNVVVIGAGTARLVTAGLGLEKSLFKSSLSGPDRAQVFF